MYQKRPLNTSREGKQIPVVPAFADIKTDLPAIYCSRRNCLLRECSDTQSKKTTGNMKFSVVFGTPGWIRTSGLQSRSLSLYPTELRAHFNKTCIIHILVKYSRCFFICKVLNQKNLTVIRKSIICRIWPLFPKTVKIWSGFLDAQALQQI